MKIRLFTIPNLLTLASLLCGSFAVVSALVYGDLALAFWLTIAAGVFDYSDGFVARLLKCPSAIGVQLDSLSDMVSFGFAPSAVLFVLWNNSLPADAEAWLRYGGSALCFAVAAFSALRLAVLALLSLLAGLLVRVCTVKVPRLPALLGTLQRPGVETLRTDDAGRCKEQTEQSCQQYSIRQPRHGTLIRGKINKNS